MGRGAKEESRAKSTLAPRTGGDETAVPRTNIGASASKMESFMFMFLNVALFCQRFTTLWILVTTSSWTEIKIRPGGSGLFPSRAAYRKI